MLANPKPFPTIEILPDDVFLVVFRHLTIPQRSKLAAVSRRWHRLIQASYADIESLSMASAVHWQSSACLEPFYTALRLCGPHLKELRLDLDSRFVDTVTVGHIRNFCDPGKLKRLELKRVTIDGQNLLDLVQHLSGLSTLSVTLINNHDLDTDLLSSALSHCAHLRVLNIKGHCVLRSSFLDPLRQSLLEFRLEDCFAEPNILSRLLHHDLQLELLHLRSCRIGSQDLLYVCQRARNLRRLDIDRVMFHDLFRSRDPILSTAIGSLRQLRHFCARGTPYDTIGEYPTDESIQLLSLTNRPTTFQTLSIGGTPSITDSGILRLSFFTQLTRLDLSHTDHAHDWSLIQLVCAGVNMLKRFYCCFCKNLDGSFLRTFLAQCPDLVSVAAYGCSKMDDDAVRRCIDHLADRRNRFTLRIGETNITVANLVSNPQFRGVHLHLDWSPCSEHGHDFM